LRRELAALNYEEEEWLLNPNLFGHLMSAEIEITLISAFAFAAHFRGERKMGALLRMKRLFHISDFVFGAFCFAQAVQQKALDVPNTSKCSTTVKKIRA